MKPSEEDSRPLSKEDYKKLAGYVIIALGLFVLGYVFLAVLLGLTGGIK